MEKRKARKPWTARRKTPVGVYARKTGVPRARGLSSVSAFQGSRFGTIEKKQIDTASTCVIDSTGAVVLLNGLQKGTDLTNRVGRKIHMFYYKLRAYALATSATGTAQIGRIMVVYDKYPNAVTATIGQILTATDVLANNNITGRDRFVKLMDQTYVLEDRMATPQTKPVMLQGYRAVRLDTIYDSSDAGDITDIQNGALYLVSLGSNAAGGTAGTLTYNVRVRFTDA